ncbi:MAG: MATE family efflux transporter [Candidatus Omnitrophica bacterium]|nr:MATE family efflux transporter [Candidatus Omnitrophota bacterium]MBU1047689.1 MATE family efflux transporter [Candidatus Omnitrophota bacterium]MBU1631432.1 MATE family efflux transporter [Candidatus Omnitrophota bacterium]MBU1888581.1 MATE family efflux transporter [Candidatus Omnitrophota bacterium]
MKIIRWLINRWRCENGYRDILVVAIPLILSTSAWAVQHFVDRMFLTWYSPEAIAAAMPAGMLNFTVMSLFIGTASYAGTFVAQYYGAGIYKKIGPSVWQGAYIAVVGGIIHLFLIPLARPVFAFIGHDPLVQTNEIIYFQVLCLGAAPGIAGAAMAGFFSGRGKTWPIMWINCSATFVNLVLDYAMIFGNWGFPEMGMKGAAIATIISGYFAFFIYLILFCKRSYNEKYHTLKGFRLNLNLFKRLMHFGLPSGIQFSLDMVGFSIFILLAGRLGTTNLAATNIAFNINTLAFMPMIGIGIAISILVGQSLGKNRPDLAERSTYSGFHMTIVYTTIIAFFYMVMPDIFLKPFAAQANPETFESIRQIARVLLRFVAIYAIFDTLNIVFSSAIKGAGDTRFVLKMIIVLSSLLLVIPSYIAVIIFHKGVYTAWTIFTFYVIALGFAFLLRFIQGKWRTMRVIEEVIPVIPTMMSETPSMK